MTASCVKNGIFVPCVSVPTVLQRDGPRQHSPGCARNPRERTREWAANPTRMMQRSLVATYSHDGVGWFERNAAAQWACSDSDELQVVTVLWYVLLTSFVHLEFHTDWHKGHTRRKERKRVLSPTSFMLLVWRHHSGFVVLSCYLLAVSFVHFSMKLYQPIQNIYAAYMECDATFFVLLLCFFFFNIFVHYQSNLLESHSSRNCD